MHDILSTVNIGDNFRVAHKHYKNYMFNKFRHYVTLLIKIS